MPGQYRRHTRRRRSAGKSPGPTDGPNGYTKITEELCGCEISSSDVSRAAKLLDEELTKWRNRPLGLVKYLILDARYEKVRVAGCVRECGVLLAVGVDAEGHRSILGVSVSLSEAEVHWREFFKSLLTRGLHGLTLITSDAHVLRVLEDSHRDLPPVGGVG